MPDMPIWDQDLASFVDRAASPNPMDWTGAACMVSGAIGMALIAMALRKSAADADGVKEIDPVIRSAEKLREDLAAHAAADVDVSDAALDARLLPRQTDQEKVERADRLAMARLAAVEVSMNAARTALDGLDVALRAAHLCNDTAINEVGAGTAVLNGALTASLYKVGSSLREIEDGQHRSDSQANRATLQELAAERHETILRVLSSRLAAGR